MFLIKSFEYFKKYQINLSEKNIKINNICWSYYDSGNNKDNKPIVIILHGFQSNKKFIWYPLIKNLTNNFRIIIPDMIGHGDTKILSNIDTFDFTLLHLVYQLKYFINSVIGNKNQFHLIGSSFGGLMASILAATYQKQVLSLTLYSPYGINIVDSVISDIYKQYNKNLLIPNTREEHNLLKSLIFYNKPVFDNKIISEYLFKYHNQKKYIYLKILYNSIINNSNILKRYVKLIKQPVLIIWGKNDNILNVKNIHYFKKNMSNNLSTYIVDKCGHLVQYEYSDLCAKLTKNHILRSYKK